MATGGISESVPGGTAQSIMAAATSFCQSPPELAAVFAGRASGELAKDNRHPLRAQEARVPGHLGHRLLAAASSSLTRSTRARWISASTERPSKRAELLFEHAPANDHFGGNPAHA